MKITFTEVSWSDYLWLQENDKKLLKRVNLLVKDITRNPFDGIGKPEPLKANLSGYWSRRINMEKLTAAAAREDFENMVKLVTEENKVYQIESARDSAVLISYKEYESLQETVELLSIPGLRESLQRSLQQIKNNETYSLDEVLGDID